MRNIKNAVHVVINSAMTVVVIFGFRRSSDGKQKDKSCAVPLLPRCPERVSQTQYHREIQWNRDRGGFAEWEVLL